MPYPLHARRFGRLGLVAFCGTAVLIRTTQIAAPANFAKLTSSLGKESAGQCYCRCCTVAAPGDHGPKPGDRAELRIRNFCRAAFGTRKTAAQVRPVVRTTASNGRARINADENCSWERSTMCWGSAQFPVLAHQRAVSAVYTVAAFGAS